MAEEGGHADPETHRLAQAEPRVVLPCVSWPQPKSCVKQLRHRSYPEVRREATLGWMVITDTVVNLRASPHLLVWKRVVLSSHSWLVGRPTSGQPYEAMACKPFVVEVGREGRGKEGVRS